MAAIVECQGIGGSNADRGRLAMGRPGGGASCTTRELQRLRGEPRNRRTKQLRRGCELRVSKTFRRRESMPTTLRRSGRGPVRSTREIEDSRVRSRGRPTRGQRHRAHSTTETTPVSDRRHALPAAGTRGGARLRSKRAIHSRSAFAKTRASAEEFSGVLEELTIALTPVGGKPSILAGDYRRRAPNSRYCNDSAETTRMSRKQGLVENDLGLPHRGLARSFPKALAV